MRKSIVMSQVDRAGEFEIEVFAADAPKSVIVCSHGNGVRRWDGEDFFKNVAEHYTEHSLYLVDQNQSLDNGGCQLNPLQILVSRVQKVLDQAKQENPGVPIIVMGHSMGCGVASQLNLTGVDKVIFVAPAAGRPAESAIKRYGEDVVNGKLVRTSDGLDKMITKEYYDSVVGIDWGEEYANLLSRYKNVFAFESGAEEIVGDERLAYRNLPFAVYKIIPGAPHNYVGESLQKLFNKLEGLL